MPRACLCIYALALERICPFPAVFVKKASPPRLSGIVQTKTKTKKAMDPDIAEAVCNYMGPKGPAH